MTEEIENTVTEAAEAPEAPKEAHEREKPPGYDPVDLSDLPEDKAQEIQNRIDYLYGQVKRGEKDWAVAQDHIRRLDESLNKVSGRLGHIEEDRAQTDIATLRRMAAEAAEEMEWERFQEINEKILEMKSAPKEEKEEKKEPDDILAQYGITDSQKDVLIEWATARDDQGNLLRPYISEDHPDYQKFIREATRTWEDPVAQSKFNTLDQFLDLVDTRMKGKTAPKVASTNSSYRPNSKKIELTEDQKRIARKLGIPEERYAAQLKAMS